MRSVRSRDTGPELLFRKALWRRGIRYRLCAKDMPGKPDIVVPSLRLAIFIDGDFWHGGQWSRRNLSSLEDQFTQTGSRDYWIGKIRRNMDRDCRSTSVLLSQGWKVLRFWESDIKKNLESCLEAVVEMTEKAVEPTPFSLAPQKNFAEFFAGIGLVRMALERHGWRVAYANDIDGDKYKITHKDSKTNPNFSICRISTKFPLTASRTSHLQLLHFLAMTCLWPVPGTDLTEQNHHHFGDSQDCLGK